MKYSIKVESTAIKRIAYNKRVLTVEFNSGLVYAYQGIPKQVAAEFAEANSKGKFYNKEIKDFYESERVEYA